MNDPVRRTHSRGPTVGRLYRPTPKGIGSGAASGRGPRLLVALHDDCGICRGWRSDALEAVAPALDEWGGRIVTVTHRTGAAACEAWVAVVDEWDQVFHVDHVGAGHVFPDPVELVEWIRFVAIQCEECEGPEGPWRP